MARLLQRADWSARGVVSLALWCSSGAHAVRHPPQWRRPKASIPSAAALATHVQSALHAAGGPGVAETEVPTADATLAAPASSPTVPYLELAQLLERLEPMSSRLEITREMATTLCDVIRRAPHDIVPSLRLCTAQLAPAQRGVELGMGNAAVVQAVGLAYGVTAEEVRARFGEMGDIGAVAQELSATRGAEVAESLSVRGALNTLLEVASTSGKGAVQRKARLVAGMLSKATPVEALYVVRTIRGSLRVGASEATVLFAVARAALAVEKGCAVADLSAEEARTAEGLVQAAYARVADLELLWMAITAGELAQLKDRTSPRIGVPVQAMLPTAVASTAEALRRLSDAPVTSEFKYDGERMQVHVSRGAGASSNLESNHDACDITIFSRSCEDVTDRFPSVAAELASWLKAGTQSLIFEAEAVAFDRTEGKILPFSDVSKRPRKQSKAAKPKKASAVAGAGGAADSSAHSADAAGAQGETAAQVCLFAFDCLSRNGESCMDVALDARRLQLRDSVAPVAGQLAFPEALDSSDESEILVFFNRALASGCEGLIMKSLASSAVYEAGFRSVRNFKLKRDYLEGQIDTFDLVVIGAYTGKGKRAGQYGAFLLACLDKDSDALLPVCKLGTGFTDEALRELHAHFQDGGLCRPAAPACVLMGKAPQPDTWLEPQDVWEVKAAELSSSRTYPGKVGLRFPRFVRRRNDKAIRDATHMSTIAEQLRKQKSRRAH